MFFLFSPHWDMFNVHTVERVNEPQVGYACCSLLEQLQQAVINTGTRPTLAHSPISRVLIQNACVFLSLLKQRFELEDFKEKQLGRRKEVYVYVF